MQVVPPTDNWEVQSIFLRGIDRYEGASKRLRRACELASLGQDEETDAAFDALFWGSEAAMRRAESYWESLTRAGGLLLGGWDSLAWVEACEGIGAKPVMGGAA